MHAKGPTFVKTHTQITNSFDDSCLTLKLNVYSGNVKLLMLTTNEDVSLFSAAYGDNVQLDTCVFHESAKVDNSDSPQVLTVYPHIGEVRTPQNQNGTKISELQGIKALVVLSYLSS